MEGTIYGFERGFGVGGLGWRCLSIQRHGELAVIKGVRD